MHALIQGVLALLTLLSALEGFLTYFQATTAFQQIAGAVWVTTFAVSLAAIGIISAIRQPKTHTAPPPQQDPPATSIPS
ncbi:hypothetical protein [Nitratidesulfovibrio sp.]|uniref:hypothetical protein n=1 Tax=Nitratidesulfovibrio sp. TaxID=2802297 RepID=UPI00333FFB09